MSRVEHIFARMEERLSIVCAAVPPIQPGAAYWLDSDACQSYCERCSYIARGQEFDLGAPVNPAPWFARDEWEDAFHEGIDGGFDTTSDSPQTCAICHSTLSYILTDEGVEQEVQYFRESPLCEVRGEDTYALDRLALNVWPGASRAQILGVSIAVNQAHRLLQSQEQSA